MKVRGKPIADLARLGIDSYVLGAMSDHLCLWQDVYRTARLLGASAWRANSGRSNATSSSRTSRATPRCS